MKRRHMVLDLIKNAIAGGMWSATCRGIAVGVLGLATLGSATNPGAAAPNTDSRSAAQTSKPGIKRIRLLIAGQALIEVDPREFSVDPYGDLVPIIGRADLAFTDFEGAVNPTGNGCNLPDDFDVVTSKPRIPFPFPGIGKWRRDPAWPGDKDDPIPVPPSVMDFLAKIGFKMMSLANNHAWDLGDCGIQATIRAADDNGILHAGTGRNPEEATTPVYTTVKGLRVALVASTTPPDERELYRQTVNGVWTGHADDWRRNLDAVREARRHADFVIYYHHFQITDDEFKGLKPGQQNADEHFYIKSVAAWQNKFARAIIDAGASIYVGGGTTGFDGADFYKGRPILRQTGGLAFQGLTELSERERSQYPNAFEGLLFDVIIEGGVVTGIEFIPLVLTDGRTNVGKLSEREVLRRIGHPALAHGTDAQRILSRFQQLSARYGMVVTIRDDRAFLSAPSRTAR